MPTIKFGHAFPHPNDVVADPIADAGDVLANGHSLGPRRPMDKSVVWTAETILKIDPGKRPVYAYVGCLHPALGRIGFIVGRSWFAREPHGVSRCDSGGLAGRVGGFQHVANDADAAQALVDLTFSADQPWEDDLATEVTGAFREFRDYLSGVAPRPSCFRDVRQNCIDAVVHNNQPLDRRLWTWEARSFADITLGDVEAVAIALEEYKELYHRFGASLPERVQFLVGTATPLGTHHFLEEDVFAMFEKGTK